MRLLLFFFASYLAAQPAPPTAADLQNNFTTAQLSPLLPSRLLTIEETFFQLPTGEEDQPEEKRYVMLVHLKVPPPYHLNAHRPGPEFLIPTVLTLLTNRTAAVKSVLGTSYRPGEKRSIAGVEVAVYEDTTASKALPEVAVYFTAAPQEKLELTYTLSHQICNDELCYPPQKQTRTAVFFPQQTPPLAATTVQALADFQAAPAAVFAAGASPPSSLSQRLSGGIKIMQLLLLAFLGGVLLNFMPCVLPVLSLKAFAFAEKQRQKERPPARLLLCYVAGIFLVFSLLAAVVIGLKFMGERVGWGFQFQNAFYVSALLFALWAMGMYLLGAYAFRLGSFQFSNDRENKKEGSEQLKQFGLGALTTLLALPCSAPFLGVSVGYAFSQSPLVIITIFLCVALGLATPYFLLLWNSRRLLRLLPRGGAWQETFRRLLAFPLFLTCLWLLDLLLALTTLAVVKKALFTLFFFTLLLWLLGVLQQSDFKETTKKIRGGGSFKAGVKAGAKAGIMALLLLSVGGFFYQLRAEGMVQVDELTNQKFPERSRYFEATAPELKHWLDFNPQTAAQYLSQEKWALVNFTAKWCLNCRLNEGMLTKKKTTELLKKYEVVALVADWTRPNNFITDTLATLGRAAIPVVALYPPAGEGAPVVFEFLTYSALSNLLAEKIKP